MAAGRITVDASVTAVINGGSDAVHRNNNWGEVDQANGAQGPSGLNNLMNAVGGIMNMVGQALPIVGAIFGGI